MPVAALVDALLVEADPNVAGALRWALAQGVARVVVKRPARAPALAGASPSHCVKGKSVRYDVYVARKIG